MSIDPMGMILIHRVETEQRLAEAERRRVISERAADRKAERRLKAPARRSARHIFRKNVETREARS